MLFSRRCPCSRRSSTSPTRISATTTSSATAAGPSPPPARWTRQSSQRGTKWWRHMMSCTTSATSASPGRTRAAVTGRASRAGYRPRDGHHQRCRRRGRDADRAALAARATCGGSGRRHARLHVLPQRILQRVEGEQALPAVLGGLGCRQRRLVLPRCLHRRRQDRQPLPVGIFVADPVEVGVAGQHRP